MTSPGRADVVRRVVTTPLWAAALLFGLYLVSAAGLSAEGYLGTDTGAKVATLDRMAEEGSWRPDIGYWAEEWDEAGTYHPLLDTRITADGEWVNVTTLPMLLAARPLYEIGGYRLALVLPMLGGVAAAFAARSLARTIAGVRPRAVDSARADDRSDVDAAGWRAFWVVGGASPIAIYALDFWEHAPGVALMLTGVGQLARVVAGDDRALIRSGAAGAAFGAAAAMRSEALVVGFVATGAACVALLVLRWRIAVLAGIATLVGFAVPWFANARLEAGLEGISRATRISESVDTDVARISASASTRVDEAAVTWFGMPSLPYPDNVAVGIVAVICLAVAATLVRRGLRSAALGALGVAVAVYLVFVLDGPAFVSGALIASPMAIGATWAGSRRVIWWWTVAVALIATPLIWTFQFTGGAGPQWGGRYLLLPTLLLTTLGAVAWTEAPITVRRVTATLAVTVTLFGVAWTVERSHGAADVFDTLHALPDDVVISTNGFFVREAGPAAHDRRYLSVGRGGTLTGAVDVVADAGFETFAVLAGPGTPDIDGATLVGETSVHFLGFDLPVFHYRFD